MMGIGEKMDELDDAPLTENHLLTHLPKSRNCPVCVRAKLYESPHLRRANQRESLREIRDVEEPVEPLERVACDHVISRTSLGNGGETCSFVIVDRYSGLVGVKPCKSKSSEEVEDAFRRFCGRKRVGIVSVGSDRAPEILSALKRLGFDSEPSEPRQTLHNPYAESFIRTLKGMTSSLLLQAGLGHEFWPLAHQYIEWAHPITSIANGEGAISNFELHHGYPYEGFKIPFCSLVWVKDLNPQPFDPKGEPALFLGAELNGGMKFKGLYRVLPLAAFKEGSMRERAVRTLAIPPGPWQFPAKVEGKDSLKLDPMPGYLGDFRDEKGDEKDEHANWEKELAQFHKEMEEMAENKGDDISPARTAGGTKAHFETNLKGKAEASKEVVGARNRNITAIRLAIHGPSKGCQACKDGTYSHTQECRARFNELLDTSEPKKSTRSKPILCEDLPSDARESCPEGDDLEDAADISGLISTATGSFVSKHSNDIERGNEVVAGVLVECLENGDGIESQLAERFHSVCQSLVAPTKNKSDNPKEWFVEFCCSSTSSCCLVAQHFEIPYLGLSKDFGDILDDGVYEQIEYWMHERVQMGEKVRLFGSIPCEPFSPLQNLNLAVQGEPYQDYLQDQRRKSLDMVVKFDHLSEVAILSGGTSSFEWPKECRGWKESEVLSMISRFSMFACYPTGCGFDLTIQGKKPLKEWRIVTTSQRLAFELNKYQCKHPPCFRHDDIIGGGIAEQSGFYNLKMATVIVSSLCLRTVLTQVPKMPTVKGAMAHEEQGLWLAQEVLALVHRPLTRDEIAQSPRAKEALLSEASQMRSLGVWDESRAIEVDELMNRCRLSGESIHISEIMPICHVKNSELPPEQQKLKGRLVFRGDACRNEKGIKAIYREIKSLPATVHSINIVLYYGLREGNKVEISDATKAYLQAPLKSEVPTWAIIPKIIWHNHWFKKYKRVACPLVRALYGHQTSGDDWFDYFDSTLVDKMKGCRIEEFPSLWWFEEWEVLVAAYVDDVIASGPIAGVDSFWKEVCKHITFDEITSPGRYLGRDHLIFELGKGKTVFMAMTDYAKSAYEMYEHEFGVLKPHETPFVSDSMLTTEGFESQGHLAGSAASLLMKLLWLARLSRPDLSFSIVSLAGSISKWSRNHDLQLKRLLGYVKHTYKMGLWGVVPHSGVPKLNVYCDADLAGDHLTCKSHSGIYVVLDFGDGESSFPLSWSSKRQTAVARSTTEAELASANEGVFQDGIPIKILLERVLGSEVRTALCEDNTACISVIQAGYSPKLRSMSRTHRISVAALSEAITTQVIDIEHVESKLQLADILTKALNRIIFLQLRNMIGVGNPPETQT